MTTIWNFIFDVFDSMQLIYLDVINWFSTEIEIPTIGTFTVTQLVFGGGLVLLLGFMVAKFIL